MSGPSDYLTKQLSDIGQGLAAALTELQRDPDPSRCEMAAIRLDGARRHCLQLADAKRREQTEGNGGGQ